MTLQMWTVYEHPADYPLAYVARMFEVDAAGPRPTKHVIVEATLPGVRAHLMMMGLTSIPRSAGDDARIVETWL